MMLSHQRRLLFRQSSSWTKQTVSKISSIQQQRQQQRYCCTSSSHSSMLSHTTRYLHHVTYSLVPGVSPVRALLTHQHCLEVHQNNSSSNRNNSRMTMFYYEIRRTFSKKIPMPLLLNERNTHGYNHASSKPTTKSLIPTPYDEDENNNEINNNNKTIHKENKKNTNELGTQASSSSVLSAISKSTNSSSNNNSYTTNTFRKDIKTIPNIITLSRILCTPALGYCIVTFPTTRMEYAVAGCILVAFSDWADGYIAKTFDQKTILGTFLDPIADKWTIAVISCSLCYKEFIPTQLVLLWLFRDILLIGFTWSFLVTNKMSTSVIEPTTISKVNTVLQFLTITSTMIAHCSSIIMYLPSSDIVDIFFNTLYWTTAGTTTLSAFSYYGYTAFTPLQEEEEEPTMTTTTTKIASSLHKKNGTSLGSSTAATSTTKSHHTSNKH